MATAQGIIQRIFQTSLDLILVVDRQGTLIRVSPSSLAILGYAPEEMVGRSAREFLHPDDLERTREEMRLARRGRQTRNFDSRYLHKGGRVVPLSWTGVWSEPEQQHFFIGRDMTDRLAAEERLRRAQHLEAVGRLTGGIAHDFNNLLSVVMGNAELLIDEGRLDLSATELCDGILHAAQRGAELTRQLLAFARQQPLEPKLVEINSLIRNVTQLLARTIGESIEIRFSPGGDLWPILIDPANLEAAMTNLAVNARDAMPKGGRLLIETANTALDEAYARDNPDAATGEYVVVVVTDTGSGMSPDVLRRIFEPFYTTKEAGKGTGLGLSMVFGFVKQSGGHIKAYSEVGVGTTFRLYLPRADAPAEQPVSVGEAAAVAGRGERVLVVEDNEAIRRLVLRQLERLGYCAFEAADAAAALAVLRTGAAVDLLFTDVVMPGGMHGHDLAREAGALRPGLKVLYMSGFPGAALTGGNGESVLSKPFRAQDLARRVREALDG